MSQRRARRTTRPITLLNHRPAQPPTDTACQCADCQRADGVTLYPYIAFGVDEAAGYLLPTMAHSALDAAIRLRARHPSAVVWAFGAEDVEPLLSALHRHALEQGIAWPTEPPS